MKSPQPRRAAVIFVLVTIALDMLALGMIAPVFAKLVVLFTGTPAAAAEYVGAFGVVWAGMQFVFSPLLGMLSDRVGRRPVILISNAATAIDNVIMALAPTIGWLFLGRAISGGATASISVASAYIADVTEPNERARAFGYIGSAFGLGFVIGPAIGGALGQLGPRVPFWAAAAFSLANFLYGYFVMPESLRPENRATRLAWARANPFGSIRILKRHRELYGLVLAQFFEFVAHEVYPTVWVLFCIAAFAWNSANIGATLALVGITSALSSAFLVGPVVKRLGERRTLVLGLAAGIGSFVLLGIGKPAFFIAGIIAGALAIYNSPAQALVTRRVGPHEQGELQGAIACVRGIAMLIGPAVFATVFARFSVTSKPLHSIGAPWYLAALLLVVALAIAVAVTLQSDDVTIVPEPQPPRLVEEP